MSTLKTVLMLLAFFGFYGIVGRMDYDDAVALEDARRQAITPNCLTTDSTAIARHDTARPEAEAELPDTPESQPALPCKVLIY